MNIYLSPKSYVNSIQKYLQAALLRESGVSVDSQLL